MRADTIKITLRDIQQQKKGSYDIKTHQDFFVHL